MIFDVCGGVLGPLWSVVTLSILNIFARGLKRDGIRHLVLKFRTMHKLSNIKSIFLQCPYQRVSLLECPSSCMVEKGLL